jgi:uncharacterized protein YlxW (UPF0749 family)
MSKESSPPREPDDSREPDDPHKSDDAPESGEAAVAPVGPGTPGDGVVPDENHTDTAPVADPDPDTDPDPDGDPPDEGAAADERARPAPRSRLTGAGVVVALLLALLGFTFVVQVRSVATDPTMASARQEDLVRILADLDAHEERMRQEIAELQDTRGRLTTAGESQQEALAEAARRADELGILSGTLPASGPGLRVEIRAGVGVVTAAMLLDAVQELRGAGAEAIQITGGAGGEVRVIASTYFVDADRGIVIDGELLRSPFTFTVIGDPRTLQPALTIPGGVVEKVHAAGGTVTMHEEPAGVEVTVVRDPVSLRFARPVS